MKKIIAKFRNELLTIYMKKGLSPKALEQTGVVMRNLEQDEKEKIAKKILDKIENLTDEEEILDVIKNIR